MLVVPRPQSLAMIDVHHLMNSVTRHVFIDMEMEATCKVLDKVRHFFLHQLPYDSRFHRLKNA